MKIDYEKIRRDNIEEYGKGTRHLAFFERLYSDGTHFVFELLQNAEDARAKRIQFALFDDRLEVRHNGRPFDENDVRGVCGVGESSKQEDLTKIGRFGIGFKSVYAFTKTPKIHCGAEHFEIRNYVRPFVVDPQSIEQPWTTLIIIPFDKDGVSIDCAKSEIGNRLHGLSARTLLFLSSVDEIEYSIVNGVSGTYLRSSQPIDESSLVTVVGEKNGALESESEQWIVFTKSLKHILGDRTTESNEKQIPPVQIAFLLEERIDSTSNPKKSSNPRGKSAERKPAWVGREIKPISESPLVVFFPTEKESQLGFLIQGPYRTTPARDNIPSGDQWNLKLIDETAQLLVNTALPTLKHMGLLTVGCFDALPIDMDYFPNGGFFYPIAEAVREALRTQELLPSIDGSFVSGGNAVLGRGEDLRALLGNEQLKVLFDLDHDVKWLSGEITADNTPVLRDYIRSELEVIEVSPDSLPPKLSAEFMRHQSDTWVANFYGCLQSWESLWRPRRDSRNRTSFRDCPIIRLEDGSHVPPFNENGYPNAYLPLKGMTQLAVVKRVIAENKSAREFLTRLGISEPDVVAEVIEELLPLYMGVERFPSASEHADHMQQIIAAWSTDSMAKRKCLEEKLRDCPFVRYHCRATGQYGYAEPSDVYFPEEALLAYFEGIEDAKFVVTTYSNAAKDLLGEIGVTSVPRCFEVSHGDPPHRHRSSGGERIKNYILDGLEEFLTRICKEEDSDVRQTLSLCLWRFLLAYADADEDYFQAVRYYHYYSSKYQTYDSILACQLRESAWLATKDGGLARPFDISVDQLPSGFELNQKLVYKLGIQPDTSQEAEQERLAQRHLAKQLGIDLEDAEFIRQNRNEFEHFRKSMIDRESHKEIIDDSSTQNRERRRKKLKERLELAPLKETVLKLRSVPGYSRSEIDRQSLFDLYLVDDVVVCQMCIDPMPFTRRGDGAHCGKCVTLFSKPWADAHRQKGELSKNGYSTLNETWDDDRIQELKVITSLNLVLCPVCFEIYRDYVHADFSKQTALLKYLLHESEEEFQVCPDQVRRDNKETTLKFKQKHRADIRDCLLVGRDGHG